MGEMRSVMKAAMMECLVEMNWPTTIAGANPPANTAVDTSPLSVILVPGADLTERSTLGPILWPEDNDQFAVVGDNIASRQEKLGAALTAQVELERAAKRTAPKAIKKRVVKRKVRGKNLALWNTNCGKNCSTVSIAN